MNSRSPSDLSRNANRTEGHAALSEFSLTPDRIHLNHGSYGAVPRAVQAAQDRLRLRIEADPTTFFGEELPALLRAQAACVAKCFGGNADDWVFCENATAAVNGILSSVPLKPDDEILTTSHAYGAVLKAMHLTAVRRGAKLTIAEVPAAPESGEQIVGIIQHAFTPKTKLLVVDHITSATAVIFPIAQIAAAARNAGVAVLVDGAHAPGQVPLDVPSLGADWYTGNAHKWLFAPRGCGLLWTTPSRQSSTVPAVLSHGANEGYTQAFDWVGTRDVTPWLCFDISANWHARMGGADLMRRNTSLAEGGAAIIDARSDFSITVPPSMRGAMAALPMSSGGQTAEIAKRMRKDLAHEFGIIAPVYSFAGTVWLRISAQIYNELDDYRRCSSAIIKLRARHCL